MLLFLSTRTHIIKVSRLLTLYSTASTYPGSLFLGFDELSRKRIVKVYQEQPFFVTQVLTGSAGKVCSTGLDGLNGIKITKLTR
jgi:hypothetical protein